ncbi:non-ribosomal peptide synthetase [Mucilaginibacter sp. KACC 22063]|uniref:non-ribosomal peptide synthetase n=1 Tax=Mucilaginibacter sp. KACC 22063 TaxID=3025666 RepID=UPI0023669621|nr:non-ribosomal peptide synthetase [Mucilaginibacter sp. KACC 22063]WDF57316.1 amino acid adenylation domain-containing protein [Mucilaginibacter sp. KACC 22063]
MEQSSIDPEPVSEIFLPPVNDPGKLIVQGLQNEDVIAESSPILSPETYHRIIYEWNLTDKDYPRDTTVHAMFEAQAARTPYSIAIIYQDVTFTYRELNERSNQLARHIRTQYKQRTGHELTRDTLVALFLERSPETVIGILATLKAGGAYVPIDTSYPLERISYMLEDSGAQLALTQRRLETTILADKAVYIDMDEDLYKHQEASNLPQYTKATDLVYVIYTSGTTGKPKGVMIEHRSILSKANFYQDVYYSDDKLVSIFYRSYAFDGSIEEYLVPILHGGKMVIYRPGLFDLPSFIEAIRNHQVTKVNMPPQLLYEIMEVDTSLFNIIKILVSGGDKLDFDKLSRFNFNCEIFNAYGPTESTNDTHIYKIDLNNPPLLKAKSCIGKNVYDCKSYILDDNRQPVDIGVAGELYVSGSGLARGYLKRPELTDERFIPNPFPSVSDIELGYTRMYRTGDQVRWLPDGNIEYLGRIDDQVKIHGYRIEPGEIEYAISAVEGVKQSCVVVKERQTGTNTSKYLVGYYVVENPQNGPSALYVLQTISKTLPVYMIPVALVPLEAFPTNANGKLDRRALPDPDFSALPDNYEAPNTATEAELSKIWQETLGVEKVGITDDFFKLGGNSILAILVSHRMSKVTGQDIKVADIFKYRTIAQLIPQLDKQCEITIPVSHGNTGELSYAQERLWFIEQYEQGTNAYHMPDVYELQSPDDIDGLKYALQQVVARHEILRTIIKQSPDGQATQEVRNEPLPIEEILVTDGRDYEQLIKDEINRPFELTKEYPIKAKFYIIQSQDGEPAQRKIFLMVNIHHMASDGWSENIFQKELAAYYEAYINNDAGFNLPPLEIQYKDYAAWQRNYLKGEVLKRQMDYWKEKLCGYQTLELSTDYPRPQNISYNGAHYSFTIKKQLSNKARMLARHYGVTLNTILLSAMNVLLGKYTGQDDIVMGSPIANRHHRQTEDMIGFFVNMQVNRTLLHAGQTFAQLVQDVNRQQVEGQTYQDLPFIRLVDEMGVERDPSRHPIFQVVFVAQNFGNQNKASRHLKKYINPHHAADVYEVEKFDISVFIDDGKEELGGLISYATSLFHKDTIVRLTEHYIYLLDQLVSAPDNIYSQVNLLLPEEYDRIIHKWNATEKTYAKEKTICRLFEEQVERTPGNTALVYDGRSVNYKELNEKSNKLARHIRVQHKLRTGQDMKSDNIVALCLDRSIELTIAILAVLKAGGAYAPMDPCYPKERLNFQIEDTGAAIVLTQKYLGLNSKLPVEKIVYIDLEEAFYTTENKSNLESHCGPGDIAYVIYTSGTTGKPKASLLEHHSLVNLLTWYTDEFNLTASSSYIICSEICFDLTQKNYLAPLINGATIYIPRRGPFDPRNICNIIVDHAVSRINCSPSAFSLILDELYFQVDHYSFEYIFLGGEPIPDSVLQTVKAKMHNGYFVNSYGPSECTDVTTYYKIAYENLPDKSIPLGIPVSNFKHYVLDSSLNPVPVGVKGELYISGIGLSREYLNNPELTDERFTFNHFATDTDKEKGYDRLYKTGDVVRWLADGNLQYLGRNDDQVKIKGFRVELGEIEQALNQIEGIGQSCVVVKNRTSEKRTYKTLVAYYTPDINYNKTDHKEILAGWEGLYDSEYDKTTEELILDADFSGWNSYITGEPIPLDEMEKWRTNILTIIKNLNPGCILEVGVGSGLLMYPLLSHVKKYVGVDLSLAIINRHKAQFKGKPFNTAFYHLKADQLDLLPEGELYDTIIINSVCQYFPDINYFDDVVEKAITRLKANGSIFLGDIRNYDLHKELIKERLDHNRMPASRHDVDRAAFKVNELLISPAYFSKFKKAHKNIRVEVIKRDTIFNHELGKYRFDVIISKTPANDFISGFVDTVFNENSKYNRYHNIPYLNQLSRESIIQTISSFLPSYMVPATYVAMESFPLTVNGKLDKRALPDPDFNLAETERVAPVTETEKEICKIWELIFGMENISITDNFFRLGGDSILSIQVAGRIRQAGYPCKVRDIFEHKTIAELAAHLHINSSETIIDAEQGILTGELDFLPIQQWFLSHVGESITKPGHWNQSFLIKVPELHTYRLQSIIHELIDRHDVFRIAYSRPSDQLQWRQRYQQRIDVPALKTLNVSTLTAAEIQQTLTDWQSNFDLEHGPLFQFGYLHGYSDGSARIFMAAHHMVIDSVSWRIVADDLKALYQGVPLPPKSSSYRQWVTCVKKYALQHPDEPAFWQNQLKGMPAYQQEPLFKPTVSRFELSEALTGSLLQNAPAAYHTEINDLLLTALAYALKDINHSDIQGITLEGHGREEIDPSIDLSRTVGWFTTMFPVKMELKGSLKESIQLIKESLRKVPNKGIGFGALATCEQTSFTQCHLPLISFNYLGQFDGPASDWNLIDDNSGTSISIENREHNLIFVEGMVIGGKLKFTIETQLGKNVTDLLSNHFETHLKAINEHCLNVLQNKTGTLTPSDFKAVKISQSLLNKLQAKG